jgi:DNA transformation protein and related proteins
MPVSPEFSDYIADLFADFGSVRVRRMFGGAGIFHNDVMIGLVADGTIYLRTDEGTASDFAAEGSAPFTYHGKSKPIVMPYWTLPERLMDDPGELADWAQRAYQAALKAKSGKKKS